MKRYKLKIPRRAIAIAAVAMAVLSFGLVVVLPAVTSPDGQEPLAAAIIAGAPIDVSSYPSR